MNDPFTRYHRDTRRSGFGLLLAALAIVGVCGALASWALSVLK